MTHDDPMTGETDPLERPTGDGEDLCIGTGRWATDALQANLGELPVATPLRLLITECWARVVQPGGQRLILQMIDVGPHNRGGELWTEAQPAIPVGEGVHACRDLFARLAQEQIEVLQHRRTDGSVAVPLEVPE